MYHDRHTHMCIQPCQSNWVFLYQTSRSNHHQWRHSTDCYNNSGDLWPIYDCTL